MLIEMIDRIYWTMW